MFARILPVAGLTLALFQAPVVAAEAPDAGRDTAVAACTGINGYAPVETVATVEDGLGDWLVWVKDKDGDLWLCNANASGAVFTNVMMEGDLLAGDGASLIGYQPVADRGGGNPAQAAEALCAAIGGYIEDMTVVATVEDGLGDYLVWLKNGNEELWMCNASGDAKLYDFEPVGVPINDAATAELRYA
jgi:hypothetical protein